MFDRSAVSGKETTARHREFRRVLRDKEKCVTTALRRAGLCEAGCGRTRTKTRSIELWLDNIHVLHRLRICDHCADDVTRRRWNADREMAVLIRRIIDRS